MKSLPYPLTRNPRVSWYILLLVNAPPRFTFHAPRLLLAFFALFAILCASAFAQSSPKLLPFQGRLTDQNGVAVSNGVRLVQFKIYDVPTGGSPVWAGELHRTTVNGGLVNVMLGTKTPLSGVDFDRQLYLEITVDVSGPSGQPDNAITAADPPMLPRQAILPVVFAKEAADSRKLDGHDWSDILVGGATNPASGTIRGDKIQLQGITAAQIFPQTITATQIASNTITSQQLAGAIITSNQIVAGSIVASNLAPGSVGTLQLASGAVTLTNLAPRQVGTTVPVGGVAISRGSGIQVFSASTPTDVANLTVTITTTGRPVFLGLIGDANSNQSFIRVQGQTGDSGWGEVHFLAGSTVVNSFSVGAGFGSVTGLTLDLPASSFHTITQIIAGTFTFKVQCAASSGNTPRIAFYYVQLVAYEL